MKKNTCTVLAALAFTGSALFLQAAFAAPVDISSVSGVVTLSTGGLLTFSDKCNASFIILSSFWLIIFFWDVSGNWPRRLSLQRKTALPAVRR